MAKNESKQDTAQGMQVLLQQNAVNKAQAYNIVDKYVIQSGPSNPASAFFHPTVDSAHHPVDAQGQYRGKPSVESGSPKFRDDYMLRKIFDTSIEGTVRAEEDRFRAAMKAYEEAAPTKYKIGVDLSSTHSVEQLWKIMDSEVEKYHAKDKKGVWGKIRHAFRKLGDGSEAVKGWLGLIPSESHYLSIVCGGLKLIIQAAARMRSVAEKILTALSLIPEILSTARRLLNVFRDNSILLDKSDALYTSILAAMGHILEYLRRKWIWKGLKVTFQQQSFEVELVEKVTDMTNARDNFNEECETCHKEALQKIGQHGAQSADELAATLEVCRNEQQRSHQAIIEGLRSCSESSAILARGLGELNRRLLRLEIPLQQLMEMLYANPKVARNAFWMNKPLDQPADAIDTGLARRYSVTDMVKGRRHKAITFTREVLLSKLDYNPKTTSADIAANYKIGLDLSKDDQERSLYVIKSERLADWVRADESNVLIINGYAKKVNRKSAMSFVCARLVYALNTIRYGGQDEGASSLVARPDVIPLHFFCGQHASMDKTWEQPSGILNSMLAQLLTHYKDVNLAQSAKLGRDFDNSDVEDMLALFKLVLKSLPATVTVFCVLDGISYYIDEEDTSEDAHYLVDGLIKLARKTTTSSRPVFKLLLTAPKRLHIPMVDSVSNRKNIVNVPAAPPNTGGFTAMKWSLGVGQQLSMMAKTE